MNNFLQLFYRGTDNSLISRSPINLGGGWNPEILLDGTLAGEPISAIVPGTQIMQIFYRGSSEGQRQGSGKVGGSGTKITLRSQWWDYSDSSTNSYGEENLGLALNGDPVVAQVPGTNTLQVFFPNSENVLCTVWREPDGSWSREQNLGAALHGAPFPLQLPGTDVLQIFYRDAGNYLCSLWRNSDGSWSPPGRLQGGPNVFGNPCAAQIPGTNKVAVFYRGPQNTVMTRQNPEISNPANFSPEVSLGGVLNGDPIVVQVPGTNELQLFYRGANSGLFSLKQNSGGAWLAGEQSIGGTLAGDPIAAPYDQQTGNVIQLFYPGIFDGAGNLPCYNYGDSDGTWYGPQQLGGVITGNRISAVIQPVNIFGNPPEGVIVGKGPGNVHD